MPSILKYCTREIFAKRHFCQNEFLPNGTPPNSDSSINICSSQFTMANSGSKAKHFWCYHWDLLAWNTRKPTKINIKKSWFLLLLSKIDIGRAASWLKWIIDWKWIVKILYKYILQFNLEGLGGWNLGKNDVLMSTSFC